MQVLDANVKWMECKANDPRLQILVDGWPDISEMVFEPAKDRSLWYGEKDGYVRFFSGHPDNPGNGYSGRAYTLPTDDGEVTLVGPYSSRAGVFNKRGFGPAVKVSITTDPAVMEKEYTFTVGHITLEKARKAAEIVGCDLKRVEKFDNGEIYWVPVKKQKADV